MIVLGAPSGIALDFEHQNHESWLGGSVTRLGDLLDFVQVFKAFGNN